MDAVQANDNNVVTITSASTPVVNAVSTDTTSDKTTDAVVQVVTQAPSIDTNKESEKVETPVTTITVNKVEPAKDKVESSSSVELANKEPKTAKTPPANTESVRSSGLSHDDSSKEQLKILREKIEGANMPLDLKQTLLDRVTRLELIKVGSGFMSPQYITEYDSAASYINWSTEIPWGKESEDVLDLKKAKQTLDKNHFGIENIKDAILEFLATIILNKQRKDGHSMSHAPILMLVGLAGTGKTTLAVSVAEALGREFVRIPFGGMSDSRVIRGQSRAYPDSEPGAIIKNLIKAKTMNPVILLDELDRVTDAARGDIMGVLLELLDPGQNKAFEDHYIDYPVNLSNVLFIATGNNTTNVSTAVLDRLQILQMPSYSDDEKMAIARSYLFTRIRDEVGLSDKELTVDDTLWPVIIRPLGYDSGIRSLDRIVSGMCRKAARLIVEGTPTPIHITEANIKQFLPAW